MTDGADLEKWAWRVAEASPQLDARGRRIAIHTYLLLAQGRPVSPGEIAKSAGVSVEEAEGQLRSWPLVFWEEGSIIGFWGLSARPLQPTHAIGLDGSTVYGWCAWDTLFITEILDQNTRITSIDPQTGNKIELALTPRGVVDASPGTAMMSLLLPEHGLGSDAIETFCHHIHFFESSQSARQWTERRPGVFSVSLDEAFELGRLTNRFRLWPEHDSNANGGVAE